MNIKTLVVLSLAMMLIGCGTKPELAAIPVVGGSGRVIATLEARVFMPEGSGPFPVAILSHGSSGGAPHVSYTWHKTGAYLAQKGYVAIGPMRKGRGKSTGASLESEEDNCDLGFWNNGVVSAMEDIDATIDYARTLPSVKESDILLFGESRGGFLSVAYAAQGKYKQDVRKVINLVGGWVAQGMDACPADFNLESFKKFGRQTSLPMLWLYGAGDPFYPPSLKDYADAFNSAGGNASFHLISGVPENGHKLPNHIRTWRPYVDQYLQQ